MQQAPQWLAGRWEGIDGPLVVELACDGAGAWTAIFSRPDGTTLCDARPVTFHPRRAGAQTSEFARVRLDRLEVELEAPGSGPTYRLLIGAPSSSDTGLAWIAFGEDHDPAQVRLFGERGASLHEAVLGVWDEVIEAERARLAWAEDPVTFRRAGSTTDSPNADEV